MKVTKILSGGKPVKATSAISPAEDSPVAKQWFNALQRLKEAAARLPNDCDFGDPQVNREVEQHLNAVLGSAEILETIFKEQGGNVRSWEPSPR